MIYSQQATPLDTNASTQPMYLDDGSFGGAALKLVVAGVGLAVPDPRVKVGLISLPNAEEEVERQQNEAVFLKTGAEEGVG